MQKPLKESLVADLKKVLVTIKSDVLGPNGSLDQKDMEELTDLYREGAGITLVASQIIKPRKRKCLECGKVFFPTKRQEYCTMRCSQKTRDHRRQRNAETS